MSVGVVKDKFETYLAAYDGTNDWDAIGPLFDALFHPEAVFVTADGELNKAQWAEMARNLTAKGATVSDFELTGEEADSFYYRVTINMGDDEPMHLTAKGTVREGQLALVEPIDPGAYSAMVDRSK